MAVTVTPQQGPITNSKLVEESAATNSAVNNTTGGNGSLYMVEIVNSDSSPVYFKLADATSATIGTTAASIVLKCAGSTTRSYVFPGGIAFSNGFSHWCTANAAESDNTAPGTPPVVRYVTT